MTSADPGATVEYAAGEAPDAPGTEEKPVREVVIGAGAPPPTPPATAAYRAPAPHGKPPPGGDHEPPPKPKRYWWRFSLASFVIVAAIAAATASSILLYLNDIADALSHGGKLHKKLSPLLTAPSGGPQNILILGSDKRAGTPGDPGRSDTTMLLRLDPDQSRIALMSIPRDLKVNIPGYGINKFNAAYTFGGPKLTLRMVKRLTGLQINHVVNVDFLGFVRAIDAIGCVWADVDRRYFHSNVGVPPSQQYSEIDIKAGYQRLCGKDALAYARYRHTDTDLVRSARQQDFLREARQRVPISTLVGDYQKLIKIFTSYTTSDVSDAGQFLEVLRLFFDARGASIKEVHFPAVLGPSYVYASKPAIRRAVDQFLGFEASGGPRGSLDAKKKTPGKKKSKRTREAQGQGPRRRRPRPRRGRGPGRGRGGGAQGQRRVPDLLPDPPALGRLLRRQRQLRAHPEPARLPPPGHRRQDPRRLPDDPAAAAARRLLRGPGDPRLERPADPQRARAYSKTIGGRDYERLPRRRPGAAGRLARGREHLLGLEQPPPDPDATTR